MITAQFQKSGQKFKAFSIEGHAGYADAGRDIVCASVTSAVQLTANAITEQFGEKAEVIVEENRISLLLPSNAGEEAALLLEAPPLPAIPSRSACWGPILETSPFTVWL